MLLPANRTGNPVHFREPPWHDRHPDFLRIDQRLPPDHLARRIDRLVDRLDLAPLFAAYAGSGSAPYLPTPLLKVALYQAQKGIHSPTQWHNDAIECEPLRWLARGFEPSRSRWYAFRDRVGPLLREFNNQMLRAARDLGLTSAERGAQDGTTVAANASRHRLLSPETLGKRLALLRQACAADGRGEAVTDRPAWMARRRGRPRQLALYEKAAVRLAQRQQENEQKRACDRQEEGRLRIIASDSDAVPGLDKLKVFRPLYNVQYLRDLDSPLILAYGVFAQVNDAGTLQPLRQFARDALGQAPRVQLNDSAYATGPHLAAMEADEAELYAPWQQQSPGAEASRRKAPAWLPKDEFTWLPGERTYVCPQGRRLELATTRTQQRSEGERVRVEEYRCAPGDCLNCPLAAWCTPKPEAGRTVSRSEHEEAFERLRARMATVEGQELYKLRKQTVELGFADLKEHRGLRRFSGRGLERAEAEVGLVVLARNGLEVGRAREAAQASA